MRLLLLILLVVLLSIAGTWLFQQPVRSVSTPAGSVRVTCRTCGGFGSIEEKYPCPECGGTGEGEWRLKRADGSTSDHHKPPCTRCRGRGFLKRHVACPACGGYGCSHQPSTFSVTTVMELSPWEQFMQWLGIRPEQNQKPYQCLFTGHIPLIDQYITLNTGSREGVVVTDYSGLSKRGDFWITTATIEFATPNGEYRQIERTFYVQNRRVLGCK